jgi:hypothetical protein
MSKPEGGKPADGFAGSQGRGETIGGQTFVTQRENDESIVANPFARRYVLSVLRSYGQTQPDALGHIDRL